MERSQYQYQPVTGPVWREPVAEKLAWLPRAQQPARAFPPNRLGDFVQPQFQALYKPEGLQWIASDRYAGRALDYCLTRYTILDPIPPADPRLLSWQPQDRYFGRALPHAAFDWSVYPQQVIASTYDPQKLEWSPQGRAPQIPVERRVLGDFAQPAFVALYDPRRLEWQAQDRYYGRALQRPPFDWTVFQQPIALQTFDPKTLDWMPRGAAPQVPLELRKVGDFQQPAFDALYKPGGLQWWAQDRYIGRLLDRARSDGSVFPPAITQSLDWLPQGRFPIGAIEIRRIGIFAQPAFSALYKPEQLQWLLTGLQPQRSIRFVYVGSWIIGTPPPGTIVSDPRYIVHLAARGFSGSQAARTFDVAMAARAFRGEAAARSFSTAEGSRKFVVTWKNPRT